LASSPPLPWPWRTRRATERQTAGSLLDRVNAVCLPLRASSELFLSRVVFPLPVFPTMMTAWLRSISSMIASLAAKVRPFRQRLQEDDNDMEDMVKPEKIGSFLRSSRSSLFRLRRFSRAACSSILDPNGNKMKKRSDLESNKITFDLINTQTHRHTDTQTHRHTDTLFLPSFQTGQQSTKHGQRLLDPLCGIVLCAPPCVRWC